MECNYGAKVSMLIDGELSAEESEAVRKHISNCQECRDLEKDFLFFRDEIKESAQTKDFVLPKNLFAKNKPFWKRGISIPVPVLAGLFIVFIVFGIFFLLPKTFQKEPITKTPKNVSNETSLARYDKGGKAEIYVVSAQQK